MEHLLSLYERPYDPDYPVVCFDEKSYQLLADHTAPVPMRPGQARRTDYEYRRCGTRNLFVMVEPLAGRRHILPTERRTKADFAHTIRYLVDVLYPHAKCIELVLEHPFLSSRGRNFWLARSQPPHAARLFPFHSGPCVLAQHG